LRADDVSLHEQIGGGGVALVYRGTFGGRSVAVKTLFDPKVDEALKQEYMDELLVMSELSHPNVVTFIGACMTPPTLYFAMELCENSLFERIHGSQRIRCDPLGERDKMRLALDVARGMQYLHGRSPAVVHRDLKSHNVLEARDGTMKICDFGLVRTKNTTAGTPAYMAPELLSGGMFSGAVDVYAFGITLCELFSGELPFRGWDYMDIRRKVTAGDRPELPRFDCPDDVRDLIRRCWDHSPKGRPSFDEAVRVLDGRLATTRDKSHCDELDSLDALDALDSMMRK